MAEADLTCQYCGRSVGNEGALTQHERACRAKQESTDATAERSLQRPAAQETEVARPSSGAAGAGAALADIFFTLQNPDAPRGVRTEAVNQSFGFASGIVNRWMDHRERSIQDNREKAQTSRLERNTQYPACDECGYQFTESEITTNTDTVRCPECNVVWDVISEETETVEAEAD